MASEQSTFSVYSIRRLPAGVWGESYALVTAFESATNEFTTEFFVITKRPSEALNSGNIKIIASPIPPELGKIDLEFTLQEGLQQTELLLMEMLEARAGELSRPDVAYSQFELKPIDTGYLLGCWMRGQFNSQLAEIQAKTRCAPLARCRGRFAPATTGRRISIRMVAWRVAPHNHADQADFRRKSLRLSRLSRLIRRPVI